ncbi:hypothetical protein ACI2K4_16940 [Micromonospora sp. NPDC050397]|uniref:hypothetical protein n=1 Tax=Micromonospora sp. NPDC050397 TaxID=3364279 RepID=UPI0038507087
MAATDPASARTEAERLVATALAAVRLGTSGRAGGFGPLGDLITGVLGHSGTTSSSGPTTPHRAPPEPTPSGTATGAGFATGSAECCVCPICRAITALRDPSPEFAERLATGAGDFAAGLASLLRALSSANGPTATDPAGDPAAPGAGPTARPEPPPTRPEPPTASPSTGPETPAAEPPQAPHPRTAADQGVRSSRRDPGDEVWREATRTGHDSWPAPERDVWSAATRAASDAPVDRADPLAETDGPTGAPGHPGPTGPGGAAPVADATGAPAVVPGARVPGRPVPVEADPGDGT